MPFVHREIHYIALIPKLSFTSETRLSQALRSNAESGAEHWPGYAGVCRQMTKTNSMAGFLSARGASGTHPVVLSGFVTAGCAKTVRGDLGSLWLKIRGRSSRASGSFWVVYLPAIPLPWVVFSPAGRAIDALKAPHWEVDEHNGSTKISAARGRRRRVHAFQSWLDYRNPDLESINVWHGRRLHHPEAVDAHVPG